MHLYTWVIWGIAGVSLSALCCATGASMVIQGDGHQCLCWDRSACENPALLPECVTLPAYSKICAVPICTWSCSFPLVAPCARGSWVCEQCKSVLRFQGSHGAAGCGAQCSSPVLWLLPLPCDPTCQMWPLGLSQCNLLSDMQDVAIRGFLETGP